MAVVIRPPNLIRRVLDPAGSLVHERLELATTVILLAGVASVVLMGLALQTMGFVLLLSFLASAWRRNLRRGLGLPEDYFVPRWLLWTVIGLAALASVVAVKLHAGNWIFGIFFGSILQFDFVVQMRQISRLAANRAR